MSLSLALAQRLTGNIPSALPPAANILTIQEMYMRFTDTTSLGMERIA